MPEQMNAHYTVHLLGGLRVVVDPRPEVRIGVEGMAPYITFERPPKSELRGRISSLPLQQIGVETIYHVGQISGSFPPTWEIFDGDLTHCLKVEREEWSFVRHFAHVNRMQKVTDISERVSTYLEILNIRLRQISESYSKTLRSRLSGAQPPKLGLASTLYMQEIEAALHAFFPDAAAFRDLLAVGCWQLVLGQPADGIVKGISAFLKRAKNEQHSLAVEILAASDDDGWIKCMSTIRDNLIHTAPLAHTHALTLCDLREAETQDSGKRLPYLHYPLTTENWLPPPSIRLSSEESDKREMGRAYDAYFKFASNSGDALEYAWRTLSSLVDLARKLRVATGIRGEMPIFPGSITFPGKAR